MEEMYFEEMRNQFDILKQQLKKQEIVSDRLLRETMKAKKREINETKRLINVAAFIALICSTLSYLTHAWSLAFAIATCVMVLFCVVATYYIHKPVERLNFIKDDFATVAQVMAKFKKQYDNWLRYVAPALIIPWLSWACYELAWKNAPAGINPWMLIIPMIIACAVGAFIGVRYHFKAVNAAQDIMDQIEEN